MLFKRFCQRKYKVHAEETAQPPGNYCFAPVSICSHVLTQHDENC